MRLAVANGRPLTARDLASELTLPLDYLHKVLRRLVRAALLESARGEQGGFRLARPADAITLLDVVEAVDGSLAADDSEVAGRLPPGAGDEIRKSLELASSRTCSALQLVSIERLLEATSGVATAAG